MPAKLQFTVFQALILFPHSEARYRHCLCIAYNVYNFACWVIFMVSCHLLFFKINVFKKLIQEHYQSVKQFGSRSGPNVMSGLILVQTICKDHQQMVKFAQQAEITTCMQTNFIHQNLKNGVKNSICCNPHYWSIYTNIT